MRSKQECLLALAERCPIKRLRIVIANICTGELSDSQGKKVNEVYISHSEKRVNRSGTFGNQSRGESMTQHYFSTRQIRQWNPMSCVHTCNLSQAILRYNHYWRSLEQSTWDRESPASVKKKKKKKDRIWQVGMATRKRKRSECNEWCKLSQATIGVVYKHTDHLKQHMDHLRVRKDLLTCTKRRL